MQRRLTEPDDRQMTEEERGLRNRRVVFAFLLLCTIVFFLVSSLPPALIPPALSKLLTFASLGAATVAALRRDRLFAEHFTHWDQAAALLALSLLAGLLTDPAAVGGALEGLSIGETSPATAPAAAPQEGLAPIAPTAGH